MLQRVCHFTSMFFLLLNDDDAADDDDTTWPYLSFPVSALPLLSMNAFEMHSLPLSLYFQSSLWTCGNISPLM